MSQSKKQEIGFGDMSYHDITAMLMNTALVAKDTHPVISVRNGVLAGVPAIVICLPGYSFQDGKLVKAETAVSANGHITQEQ